MRSLLITLLLISTVLLIYSATIGSEDGAMNELKRSSEHVQTRIQSLNP